MKRGMIYAALLVPALMLGASDLQAKMGPDKNMDRRGGPVHGREGHMDGPRGPLFGNPEMMQKQLGLTGEQVNKISEINLEYKKQFMTYHEKIAPKHIRLRRMLLDDNVDLKEVRSLLKEISDLQLETRMLRIRHRLDIEKILTPEQKTKLKNERIGMKMDGPPERDDF